MRNLIRSEVESIYPHDELERQHRADVLTWIDSGAELCRLEKPAIPPKHLVSYVVVLSRNAILLVDHRSAKLWLPTGGHVEPRELPRETAKRELFEELGIAATGTIGAPRFVTCTTTVGMTSGHVDVSLWYVAEVNRDQPLKYDNQEFVSVRWFAFPNIPFERADPHMERFITKIGKWSR